MDTHVSPNGTSALLEFLYRLGQAYLASGEQTAEVELFLRRIASAAGVPRARVVAFPTAVFISLQDGPDEYVTLAEGPRESLRLDQIADVYALGDAAQRGTVAPREGLDRLAVILARSARFGPTGIVVGHTTLTLGLAIVLMPAATNLAAAIFLGAVVGLLKVFNRGKPVLAVPLSVVAAALVSVLVYLAVKWGLPVDPQHALVPPLVAFLPGAMLTLGMVELAYGDMISGSSRLVTGFVQLVLLAFGLAAGAAFVGISPSSLITTPPDAEPSAWAPWAGVVVFGLGVYIHFSAPRNSLPWTLPVLLLAFAAQRLTAGPVGKEFSGFFGALLATPLSYLIQMRFRGPPAMVTFLPCFWLLVPGSLGLLSVTRMLNDRAAGFDGMITAVFALASIALGTLMGASLYRWLTEKIDGPRLQVIRVGPSPQGEKP